MWGIRVQFPREGVAELRPAAVTSFHGMVADMLEELHREARVCSAPEDATLMLAKRDALSELSRRMQGLPGSPGGRVCGPG